MVAPMPAAGRLNWILALFVLFICSSFCKNSVKSVIRYDFLTLLNIRASVADSLSHRSEQWRSHRALRRCIPGIAWTPSCSCSRPRQARRRSRRAGSAVKLRKLSRDRSLSGLQSIATAADPCRRLSCLRPVLPASPTQLPAFVPVPHRRAHMRVASVPACARPRPSIPGGDHRHPPTSVASVPECGRAGSRTGWLRPIPRASTFGRAGSDRINFGLLNARSIANKSFVLNELFVSKNLDFLQITETWQRADDFTSLIELCPRDCSFSYAPRSTGRGGGLATILRDCFHSRTIVLQAFQKSIWSSSRGGDGFISWEKTGAVQSHAKLRENGEMIFIDSSGNCVRHNHRIFLLLTHSSAGGLPLGGLITTSESQTTITAAMELFNTIMPNEKFFGRPAGPCVIMTDDCAALRQSLCTVYPKATLVLCVFHLLQAMWSWLWNTYSGVPKQHRAHLLKSFKVLVYAETSTALMGSYTKLMEDHIAVQHPKFLRHLKEVFERREEWAICLQSELATRGNHTNNFVESAMRVVKEKVLHRLKAYNVTQLVDFVTTRMEAYYIRRLTDAANNRLRVIHKKGEGKGDINSDAIVQEDQSNYTVASSSSTGVFYHVNMAIGCCTCPVGISGGPWKHQSAVASKFGQHESFPRMSTPGTRKLYHEIATAMRKCKLIVQISAFSTFGKCHETKSRRYKRPRGYLQTTALIGVQPTAVARINLHWAVEGS
ncbi:hypothetical protein SKAU_G00280490 [Synaphobranchus kaupii]|uniref:MULE transposase domain-containing protein n=1 Tax=Synaphobranchus kaupii TaxID=118154 RepID=A0A9Q1EX45_SYNKA|nr:hypothetical protein SKAU_G00280490 [Synaphobranchus kaupii]